MESVIQEVIEEESPSLRAAAHTLYACRHDPNLEVDVRIAAAASGVMWIGGGALAAIMLAFSHPRWRSVPRGGRSPRRSSGCRS